LEAARIAGQPFDELVHPEDRERVTVCLTSLEPGSIDTTPRQFRMRHSDGWWRDVEAILSNQVDRPSVAGYVANVRDITERKQFETLLAHRALHDPLTGLANRQLIFDRAEQMLVRSRRTQHPVTAFFIDLDNFKDVNDSLGHAVGDLLLQAVATRFSTLVRASDTLGRLGGDEFIILAEGPLPIDGSSIVADRIRHALEIPFSLDGVGNRLIRVTCSTGIATGDRASAQDLLRDADIALYRAKSAGKDRCVLFEPAMNSAVMMPRS
jgi:diguanylate cyclase (GGDEF)-like protein